MKIKSTYSTCYMSTYLIRKSQLEFFFQGRIGSLSFVNDDTQMKLRLDNEFDLVFVAGFQKILKLMYVDKLLDDVHLEFRDKYKGSLMDKNLFGVGKTCFLSSSDARSLKCIK